MNLKNSIIQKSPSCGWGIHCCFGSSKSNLSGLWAVLVQLRKMADETGVFVFYFYLEMLPNAV